MVITSEYEDMHKSGSIFIQSYVEPCARYAVSPLSAGIDAYILGGWKGDGQEAYIIRASYFPKC